MHLSSSGKYVHLLLFAHAMGYHSYMWEHVKESSLYQEGCLLRGRVLLVHWGFDIHDS
jgi:hypothetical protein